MEKYKKNIEKYLNHKLKKMIQFLRTQEHQYLKISKNVSTKENSASDFDFMTQEVEDWEEEGRENMVMIDITKQDSAEEMKNVFAKINQLTKMMTSMNEVRLAVTPDRCRAGRRSRPN